jgi:hypothetical protein
MNNKNAHTFHIPVMGLGYTIDSPIKVAHLGISSVMSILEHNLLEKMRMHYSKVFNKPYEPISPKDEDFRAKRVMMYLNLVDEIVREKFEKLKNSIAEKSNELELYFDLLPSFSELKKQFEEKIKNNEHIKEIKKWLDANLKPGSIDVNIMTKLDSANFVGNEQLPIEHNNAHAAIRGFAKSNLNSSIILSAGLNPRLFSYMENFNDFYPDSDGNFRKKIVIKVSDFRSALIQGKFFAKKGLWVSEYRIESGLNCGGHAFPTDGFLLGPILEEFKIKRTELFETIYSIYKNSLVAKGKILPDNFPEMKITAQGGVGTSAEHNFLIKNYNVDSVGWGSPFLLVPEATTVDDTTMKLLSDATEDDLYLSNASPLGILFNNIKGSSKNIERIELAQSGKPGSACPKKFLQFNNEYGKPLCTASSKFINLKLNELKNENLPEAEYLKRYNKIIEKECLCNGLASSALLVNNLDIKMEGPAVSICPGPNIAYFSGRFSLKEMVDHIYGRINILNTSNRPNMFVKELKMYVEYLIKKIEETNFPFTDEQVKDFRIFISNLYDGIEYYKNLFSQNRKAFEDSFDKAMADIHKYENQLREYVSSCKFNNIFSPAFSA